MDLHVVIRKEPEEFWAAFDELPGCWARGRTLSELHAAIPDTVGLYLWDLPGVLVDEPPGLGRSQITVVPPGAARSRA